LDTRSSTAAQARSGRPAGHRSSMTGFLFRTSGMPRVRELRLEGWCFVRVEDRGWFRMKGRLVHRYSPWRGRQDRRLAGALPFARAGVRAGLPDQPAAAAGPLPVKVGRWLGKVRDDRWRSRFVSVAEGAGPHSQPRFGPVNGPTGLVLEPVIVPARGGQVSPDRRAAGGVADPMVLVGPGRRHPATRMDAAPIAELDPTA
jgi:hypothetical protein